MKKMIFSLILVSFALMSCTKRVTCEGILLSPHGVPMSNTKIYFNTYGSPSSYPTGSISFMTDAKGAFYFYENVNKKYPMELEVMHSDSGYVRKSLGKPADRTYIRENITLH